MIDQVVSLRPPASNLFLGPSQVPANPYAPACMGKDPRPGPRDARRPAFDLISRSNATAPTGHTPGGRLLFVSDAGRGLSSIVMETSQASRSPALQTGAPLGYRVPATEVLDWLARIKAWGPSPGLSPSVKGLSLVQPLQVACPHWMDTAACPGNSV